MQTVTADRGFIKAAPDACGVYLMKDETGRIIYVGKAKNLRKRIASYFRNEERYQVQFLLRKLHDIEYILTVTEKEALLLENNLIKRHSPRYNIQLKDDKNYLCIMVDTRQPFPRIELVRQIHNFSATYFGPYPSARAIREVIDALARIFPLRRCSDRSFSVRKKPCLYHDIGQCMAPCIHPDAQKRYRQVLNEALLFLRGKGSAVLAVLKRRMWEAADKQDYERAAFIRDVIGGRTDLLARQGVVSVRLTDRDVIGSFTAGTKTNLAMLFVRGGRLLHKRDFSLPAGLSLEETLSQFIFSYYTPHVVPPDEIVTETVLPDHAQLEELLFGLYGRKIRIRTPADGETKKLMDIARLNATTFFKPEKEGLETLRTALGLDRTPFRIECYDVAHMYGQDNVCAMTVSEEGLLKKSDYRLFNIDEDTNDDYRMLALALTRRFGHAEWPLPDILMVDGGKGQLGVAVRVLKEHRIENVLPIAITKDEDTSLFLPNRKNPLILKRGGDGLKILTLLREEAHRFANVQLKKRLKTRTQPAGLKKKISNTTG